MDRTRAGVVGNPDSITVQKLAELMKRNKSLNVQVEKEKTEKKRAQQDKLAFERQLSKLRSDLKDSKSGAKETALQDKLREKDREIGFLQNRLSESKSSAESAKQECARLSRALTKELGDDVSLDKALDDTRFGNVLRLRSFFSPGFGL